MKGRARPQSQEVLDMLAFSYAAGSETGLHRRSNQDAAFADHRLLVVADGLGGHAGGDVASSIAVDRLSGVEPAPGPPVLVALEERIRVAGRRLHETAARRPHLAGMGTTLTVLLLDRTRAALAHVGDSRAYLLRDGRLHQLTTDHTVVRTLIDSGLITSQEATRHPHRSVLCKALDAAEAVEPDLSVQQVYPGDRFLLCSDGLSGVVQEDVIQSELTRNLPPAATVQELIGQAYRRGAPDNVTCVVADVIETRRADPGAGHDRTRVGATGPLPAPAVPAQATLPDQPR
jgi:protein phosphatase